MCSVALTAVNDFCMTVARIANRSKGEWAADTSAWCVVGSAWHTDSAVGVVK